jgi:hypothetical protein
MSRALIIWLEKRLRMMLRWRRGVFDCCWEVMGFFILSWPGGRGVAVLLERKQGRTLYMFGIQ